MPGASFATAPTRPALRALLVGLLWAPLAACSVEHEPLAELPFGTCVCRQTTPPSCPLDTCDLELEVEAGSCAGKVNLVEIMVGDKLEKHIWTPGVPARTCATVKRGETFEVYARADTAWAWMPEITCPPEAVPGATTGETLSRVLQCVASK